MNKKILYGLLFVACLFSFSAQALAAFVPQTPDVAAMSLSEQNDLFIIRWKAVDGATSYLVSVYTRNDYNSERNYLVKDHETTKLSVSKKKPTDGTILYFRVKAKSGDAISPESEELLLSTTMEYKDLPAPTELALTDQDGEPFLLKWKAEPKASSYIVKGYTNSIAPEAQTYTFRESFDNLSQGAEEEPIDIILGVPSIDDYCEVKGWGGNVLAMANGAVVIRNTLQPYFWSYFDLPMMTLGKEGDGKFTFRAHIKASAQDSVVVHLWEVQEGGNHLENLETQKAKLNSSDEEVTLHFTQGKPHSFLSIEVHTFQGEDAYIEEVSVSRDLAKGDEMQWLKAVRNTSKTEAEFSRKELNIKEDGYRSFEVYAQAWAKDRITSVPTNQVSSAKILGVESIDSVLQVRQDGQTLWVTLSDAAPISLYSVSGEVITSRTLVAGTHKLLLPKSGAMYILQVGQETRKLIAQ